MSIPTLSEILTVAHTDTQNPKESVKDLRQGEVHTILKLEVRPSISLTHISDWCNRLLFRLSKMQSKAPTVHNIFSPETTEYNGLYELVFLLIDIRETLLKEELPESIKDQYKSFFITDTWEFAGVPFDSSDDREFMDDLLLRHLPEGTTRLN